MIEEAQKFDLRDSYGRKTASLKAIPIEDKIEVVEMEIGKEKAHIAVGDLRTVLFAISGPVEQKKMLPIQMVTQRRYQTMLGVKAERNIKKGEMVNFKVDIPLPPIEKEIMLEAARQIKKGIIKPIA